MENNKAIMQFIDLTRVHTKDDIIPYDVDDIKDVFLDIINSVVKQYPENLIPGLIICKTYNKYSTVLPIKTKNKYNSYYLLYDRHLNEINSCFNRLFLSEGNIEHDIWKLSYELFAEEALLVEDDLMTTYYGLNKIALGPFVVLEDEFEELEFILEIQEKYILVHEVGHWLFSVEKQGAEGDIINTDYRWKDIIEEIYALLYEIYVQYGLLFQNEDYKDLINEQSQLIHDNINIVEECFADAVAYAFIFSFVSDMYSNQEEMKLLAAKSLFLQMMNLQILAMHHMTVSEETFENATSIRLGFFRNYVGLYFEENIKNFEELLEETVIRYENRITNPMLEAFCTLEKREMYIQKTLSKDNDELAFEDLVGLKEFLK